jgi:hypothetical protein
VDTNYGFFPEREVLRARRLKATTAEPVRTAGARKQRTEMWVLWVAVFLPMFVNAITFGWNGHITPRSMTVLLYTLSLTLVACGACVAIGVRHSLRGPNHPSS